MVYVGPRSVRRSWAILFLFTLVVAPGAAAQEPPTFPLPEVVVPGKRPQPQAATPAAVTVITREAIARWGARTIAEALRVVPELTVRTYGGLGGLAEASIRGSTPGQVLVLLDGIPLNNVALGQTDLSTISVDAVERIEVLRGPFAAIYGSGALGGVINIVTAKEGTGRFSVRAGGFGQRSATLTAGISAPLTATVDAASGHRPNSDYAGTTVAAHIAMAPAVGLLLHYYSADLGTPGDLAFPTPGDRQAERRALAQISLGQADRDAPWGRFFYVSDTLTFTSPSGTSTYYSSLQGGEVLRAWRLSPERLVTAGLEIQQQYLDALVFGSTIVEDATVGAGHLQYDAALSPRVLVSAGLRLDAHSSYGATLNPRAGVVYQLNDVTRLRAAVGRTFRGPTFLHLFFPGCSNPALLPETAWSAEVGVERRWSAATMTATAFGTEATDLITGGCPPQNVGAASIRGLSVEFTGPVAANLTLTANLTAIEAVDKATGSLLPRVPGFAANITFEHQVTQTSTLSLLAAYTGPRSDLDFSTFPATMVQMAGYLDIQIHYRVDAAGDWTVTLGVDNLLDYQYEPVKGFPAPGRGVFVTATKGF